MRAVDYVVELAFVAPAGAGYVAGFTVLSTG